MGILRALFGPSKDEVWGKVAEEVRGEFVRGGFFGRSLLRARTGVWTVTLDTYTESSGESSTTYTRMRAPFVSADQFQFQIYTTGLLSGLGKALGMQDIEIGDAGFDKQFVLKGNDEAKVKRFFDDDGLKALLYTQKRVHFRVKGSEGWFGKKLPQGVEQLYFQRVGVMKDGAELRALVDLFSYSLTRLSQLGSAREEDPGVAV